MSRYAGNGEECPHCKMTYRQFRTGLDYRAVFQLMMDSEEDSKLWKYKRRNTVLGHWHQMKRELWGEHLTGGMCFKDPRNVAALREDADNDVGRQASQAHG